MTDPRSSMPGAPAGLVDRVKNILMTPKTEWPRIDAEPATVGGLYTGYIMILAAIGPVAGLLGAQLLMGAYRPAMSFLVATAVLGYVMTLVSVFVFALIIDALAASFGGTKNNIKALQTAAYASTAVWIASILQIVPMLGLIAVLVGMAYAAYLLYLGLGVMMKVPADKAVGYTVVVIVAYIVLYFVLAAVVGMIVLSFFSAAVMTQVPMIR